MNQICPIHGKVPLNKAPKYKKPCEVCGTIYSRFNKRVPILRKGSQRHNSAKDYKRTPKHKKPLF